MVIIFGFGDDAKDLGPTAPATCPNCHNIVYLHHIHSERKFSLFFVPLVPISSNEYLACPVCKHALPIPQGREGLVRHMHGATNAHRHGTLAPDAYQAEVERFWASMGRGPDGRQLVRGAPAAAAAGPYPGGQPARTSAPALGGPGGHGGEVTSVAEELSRLARLHRAGGLSDDEFAVMKKRLLNL